MEFVKEGDNASVVKGKPKTYNPTKNVRYANKTLQQSEAVDVMVNSSKLGLTTTGASALFVQIRFYMSNGKSFPSKGINLHSFLGSGFKPTTTNFTEYKKIQSSMMATNADYRNYTFFVDQR
jgi:hypothetical protein